MELSVFSEIGALRAVLVHAPGAEVDRMPPSMMGELLFDDIVHGPEARLEHQRFCAVLERLGATVLDTRDLLCKAIESAPARVPELLSTLDDLEGLGPEILEELRDLPAAALADALIHGVLAPSEKLAADYLFRLPPLPNLLFTRDPHVVLGHGVVIGAMSRGARRREPLLSRFIFRHHPAFAGAPIVADYLEPRRGQTWLHQATPTLEGGDVLVFHEGVVLVGVSERTMERAVDILVQRLRALEPFKTLIMVPMPRTRSVMHLDTIFTRTSREECLVYSPMILPESREALSVVRIDLRAKDDWGCRRPSLLGALAEAGVELEPIPCGGPDDYIRQAREQWTDGANSFAVRPGVVLLYSRNTATADELARRGYQVVRVEDMAFDAEGRCLHEFRDGVKYAILVAGGELSRARGGPRCMTMPLARDPVA